MTTTPPEAPSGPSAGSPDNGGPRVTRDEMRDLGRLRRSATDRKVAGVAGGLARHLDIDPVILRVAFVVLTFFGGAGLILYAAFWALVPEEDHERAAVDLDERSRTVALVALAVIAALALIGDSWGAFWFPWPLVVIAAVAGVIWLSVGTRRSDPTTPPPPPEVDPETGEPLPPAAAGWTGGPTTAYPVPAPRPRDPRKRGPVLFWFTLLLIAVAEGVLGIVDAAGAPVADSAYPALATGVIATMLVVGSFVGRAGGLIALGLIASLGLVGATAADRWDGDRFEYHPTSGQQVQDTYTMDTGSLVLDLTDLDDVGDLDGRTVELRGNVGEILVRVPDDVNVTTDARIDGPGGYDLYDGLYTGGGFDSQRTADWRSAADDPTLTLDADLEVGQITVELE